MNFNFYRIGWDRTEQEPNPSNNLTYLKLREGVNNIQRGGALKFSAEGCKTLTPPKNSSTDMYPPLNCQQQS